MRRIIAAAALLIAPSLLAYGHDSHHRNISISTDDYEEVTSCSQIRVTFDDAAAVRAEEELPAASLRSLKINSDKNGGVRVAGWDQPRYAVTVCKAAADASLLSQVRARLSDNEVTTDGPEDSNQWVAYILVRTPRNATLDVEAMNGPIGVHSVNGTINVRAQNGPISVKDSSGTIDATTQNGPISLSGGSGNVKITATNGPLSVKLNGDRWDGSLEATTQNGPLSLKLPRNYGSVVDLSVKGHGPISCKAEACRDLKRSWHDDDDRTPRQLSFGSGARNVSVSTVNGPLVVKEADE
jgi:DUF4097 and DUF4098 domain-containing protein YvlB